MGAESLNLSGMGPPKTFQPHSQSEAVIRRQAAVTRGPSLDRRRAIPRLASGGELHGMQGSVLTGWYHCYQRSPGSSSVFFPHPRQASAASPAYTSSPGMIAVAAGAAAPDGRHA